jgi:hypothetical protein
MEWSAETVVPAARTEMLVVEQLADETLVYDLDRAEAHHLFPAAAVVFELCDGQRTVQELAKLATERLGEPVSTDTVRAAVEQLAQCALLVDDAPQTDSGVSRRDLVRKAALVGAGAAAAAPLIRSITAPTPAQAQSSGCGESSAPCLHDSDCCEGCFCCLQSFCVCTAGNKEKLRQKLKRSPAERKKFRQKIARKRAARNARKHAN